MENQKAPGWNVTLFTDLFQCFYQFVVNRLILPMLPYTRGKRAVTVYRSVSPGRELDDQQLKPSHVHAIASKIPVPPHIHNVDLRVNRIRLKPVGKNPQKNQCVNIQEVQ